MVTEVMVPVSRLSLDGTELVGSALTTAKRLRTRSAHIAVLGLGYAGLPLAVEFAKAGFRVTGLDVNGERVEVVNRGQSPVSDVADADVAMAVDEGRLTASTRFDVLDDVDCALVCVPTPLDSDRGFDVRHVKAASESIAAHLHPGMLVILQSTSSPGTTRQVMLPVLERSSDLRVGEDFFVAFAPERIDPGNGHYKVHNTPKVLGGITKQCTELAALLFAPIVQSVQKLSCPEVAEMTKLVENTFRFVNIGLVNEMAVICDHVGINVWEVIDAASTKPFAFMPHYPGPGVGGECIPVVPFFLHPLARDCGLEADLIEAAGRINDRMPKFVVEKLESLLAERGASLLETYGLILGVAYKQDSSDVRESPALRVIELLLDRGARFSFYDPYVPRVRCKKGVLQSITEEELGQSRFDYALLLTPHSVFNYADIGKHVGFVLDTRNRFSSPNGTVIVKL